MSLGSNAGIAREGISSWSAWLKNIDKNMGN